MLSFTTIALIFALAPPEVRCAILSKSTASTTSPRVPLDDGREYEGRLDPRGGFHERQEPCFFGGCDQTVAPTQSVDSNPGPSPGDTSTARITQAPQWLNQTIHATGHDLATYGNATFKTVCSSTDKACYASCTAAAIACASQYNSWHQVANSWFYSRIKPVVNGSTSTIMTTNTYTDQDPIKTYSHYRTTNIETIFLSDIGWASPTSYNTTYRTVNNDCETSACLSNLRSTLTTKVVYSGGGLTWVTQTIPYALGPGSAYTTSTPSPYFWTRTGNWEPAYPTPFTLCSLTNRPDLECSFSKDCSKCTIHGGTVQLLYFPVSRTQSYGVTVVTAPWQTASGNVSRPTITASPDPLPTVSYHNTTLKAPNVYISFHTAYAENECGGQIGKRYPGAILALPQSDLSSVLGGWGVQYSTVKDASFPVHSTPYLRARSFDLADLNWPVPYLVYVAQPKFALQQEVFSIVFDDYNPTLVVPPQIRSMDPAWADCELDWEGLYDPPKALQPTPVAAALTLSSDPQMTTPAATIATPSLSPVQTSSESVVSTQPGHAPSQTAHTSNVPAASNGAIQTHDPALSHTNSKATSAIESINTFDSNESTEVSSVLQSQITDSSQDPSRPALTNADNPSSMHTESHKHLGDHSEALSPGFPTDEANSRSIVASTTSVVHAPTTRSDPHGTDSKLEQSVIEISGHEVSQYAPATSVGSHLVSYGSNVVIDGSFTLTRQVPTTIAQTSGSLQQATEHTVVYSAHGQAITAGISPQPTRLRSSAQNHPDHMSSFSQPLSRIEVFGHTLSAGGPGIDIDGLSFSLNSRSLLVVPSTEAIIHSTAISSESTISTQSFGSMHQVFQYSATIGSRVLSVGGSDITLDGMILSLARSGLTWTTTPDVPTRLSPVFTNTAGNTGGISRVTVVTLDGVPLRVLSKSDLVEVNGHTMAIGGPGTNIDGVTLSAGSSGIVAAFHGSSTTVTYRRTVPTTSSSADISGSTTPVQATDSDRPDVSQTASTSSPSSVAPELVTSWSVMFLGGLTSLATMSYIA